MSYFPYHQGNAMNDNQRESEPLLDDADYELLRNDSLLARVGSNNFASLIETSNPLAAQHEELNRQQQQQFEHQFQQQDVPSDIQFIINNSLSMDTPMLLPSSQLTLDPAQSWCSLEDEILESNTREAPILHSEAPVAPCDGNSSTSFTPDSSPTCQVPSLQIWPGQYDFGISLPVGNKDRNKWCYSSTRNKLYLCPFIAVPIDVKVLQWFDATITITPVFRESRHRVDPVMPCFMCKSKVTNEVADHLIMVEGQECTYKQINERHVVSVPLHPPPPGEVASTLLVKSSCLTSCIGGPNRRPFCLVFTLHDSSGTVVGRQVLDLKCCRCPSRDMMNDDEKTALKQQPDLEIHPLDHMQVLKRSAPVTTSSEKKKKRFNIKLEQGTENRYTSVTVPVEYVSKVKAFINGLIAEEFIRRNQPSLLLYSEDEL